MLYLIWFNLQSHVVRCALGQAGEKLYIGARIKRPGCRSCAGMDNIRPSESVDLRCLHPILVPMKRFNLVAGNVQAA